MGGEGWGGVQARLQAERPGGEAAAAAAGGDVCSKLTLAAHQEKLSHARGRHRPARQRPLHAASRQGGATFSSSACRADARAPETL